MEKYSHNFEKRIQFPLLVYADSETIGVTISTSMECQIRALLLSTSILLEGVEERNLST